MPLPSSNAVIACAGSGKTTRLVEIALEEHERRVAMITYTNNNVREIKARFGEVNSGVPPSVDVMTWFSFLLQNCARPYQRSKYDEPPIETLTFINRRSAPYVRERETARYYTSISGGIYSDKISRFVVECEHNSGGAVTARLNQIYSKILIDEFQDLAGWDLDVVYMLLTAGLNITLVGDPRQHVYSTNPSSKNRQYLGTKVLSLVTRWERDLLCSVETVNTTYRCPEEICVFSNHLWPDMEGMISEATMPDGHVGVYLVPENSIKDYIQTFSPRLLCHDRRSKDYGFDALNFGLAKGLQFEHVLIIPTGPIRKFLHTGDANEIIKGRDRLHVAVTRASRSVGFVYDGTSPVVAKVWSPSQCGSSI